MTILQTIRVPIIVEKIDNEFLGWCPDVMDAVFKSDDYQSLINNLRKTIALSELYTINVKPSKLSDLELDTNEFAFETVINLNKYFEEH